MAQAKRKKKLSFEEAVKSNAKAPEKKKAGKVQREIITDAPQNVKEGITKVLEGKREKKSGESKIKVGETPVIEFGLNLKDERALNGDYNKSYKIQGENEEDVVTFVTANRYSHKVEDEEEIEEIMGEDNFDEMIPENFKLTVKDAVFEDPKMQDFIMKAFGEKFGDYFEVEKTRKVIPNFDEELYKRFDQDKIDDIKVYVKQAKPSIK